MTVVHPVQTYTYLEPRLTLSLSGLKQAFTSPMSPGVPSDAPKTIYEPIAR
jgi:hypothetical protein